ncbi:MAG: iron-containing alcohol dehydrogenase [Eubacteriales bacterium]
MNFNFYMPVKIIAGAECLKNNTNVFQNRKRCIIITGKNSARLSGALDDVTDILQNKNIGFIVYDKIPENPLVSVCDAGAQTAIKFGADFVIGIGGGSALDASKAIAALAANTDMHGDQIFTEALKRSLPLIVIPTTAGTGSEANNYSVLSLDGQNKKRTFKNDYSYPAYAFLDAKYTHSLNAEYTLSTALDAFCHCIESFMSPNSTVFSEAAAVYGAAEIWNVFKTIYIGKEARQPSYAEREILLCASCAAGAAINTTGTGFPHPMGYNFTMFGNIPHGRACAAFTGAFIEYTLKCSDGAKRIAEFDMRTGIAINDIKTMIPALASVKCRLSDEEIELYIRTVRDAGNFKNSPYKINETEMAEIYRELF